MFRVSSFMLVLLFAVCALAEERQPQMSITGQGTVSAKPDIGYFLFEATTIKPTASEAVRENSIVVNALYKSLKGNKYKVDEKDIQTVEFYLNEHFKTVKDGNTTKRVKDGYIARNRVRVTVRNLSSFGQILDAMTQGPPVSIANIWFGSSKKAEYLSKARKLAARNALNKATVLCQALDTTLKRVVSISEYGGSPRYKSRMAMAAPSSAMPIPISEGSLTFTVQVNVTWEIGNP